MSLQNLLEKTMIFFKLAISIYVNTATSLSAFELVVHAGGFTVKIFVGPQERCLLHKALQSFVQNTMIIIENIYSETKPAHKDTKNIIYCSLAFKK